MPNIREYTSPDMAIRPSETGAEAQARSGRIINEYYREAGSAIGGAISTVGRQVGEEIDRHNTAQEISKGFADGLTQKNAADTAWSDAAKDPNFLQDPQNQQKFLQQQGERWQEWAAKFSTKGGQAWAQRFAMEAMNHTATTTHADMVNHAGDMAQVDLMQARNQAADMAMKSSGSLDFALTSLDGAFNARVDADPNLSVEARSKLKTTVLQNMKTSVVHAAVLGLAQKDPDAAERLIADSRYSSFIDPSTLRQSIYTIKKGREADARMARVEARQLRQEQFDAREQDYFKAMSDPNTDRQGLITKMLADPGVSVHAKPTLFSMLQRQPKFTSDPGVFGDFAKRLGLPPEDPRHIDPAEIYQRVNEDLSLNDANFLLSHIKLTGPDAQMNAHTMSKTFSLGEEEVAPKAGGGVFADPRDVPAAQAFNAHFAAAWQQGIQAGLKPEEIADPTNKKSPVRMLIQRIQADKAARVGAGGVLPGSGLPGVRQQLLPGAGSEFGPTVPRVSEKPEERAKRIRDAWDGSGPTEFHY